MASALPVVRGSLEYLGKRREQIRYAEYELMGLPIGSGIVESANKLLVEERLKGSGMHWARQNVNPMLALRAVAFNDRWAGAMPRRGGTAGGGGSPRPPPPGGMPAPLPTNTHSR
jgi:hypothetical protein